MRFTKEKSKVIRTSPDENVEFVKDIFTAIYVFFVFVEAGQDTYNIIVGYIVLVVKAIVAANNVGIVFYLNYSVQNVIFVFSLVENDVVNFRFFCQLFNNDGISFLFKHRKHTCSKR